MNPGQHLMTDLALEVQGYKGVFTNAVALYWLCIIKDSFFSQMKPVGRYECGLLCYYQNSELGRSCLHLDIFPNFQNASIIGREVLHAHLIKSSVGTTDFSTPFYLREPKRWQTRIKFASLGAGLPGFYADADGCSRLQETVGLEFKTILRVIQRLPINAAFSVENGEADGALVGTTFR